MALTAKQEAFALAVFDGATAAEAYRRTYTAAKMSDKSVWEAASRLAANAKVAARIDELRAVAAKRALVSKERVLCELARVAFTNLNDVVSWPSGSPELKVESDITPDAHAALKKVKVKRERVWRGQGDLAAEWEVEQIEVELHSKLDALKALAQHLGMFPKAPPAEITINNDNRSLSLPAGLSVDELRRLVAHDDGDADVLAG